ncbi:hypothetical protein AUP68_14685 [Ilyonectria robusta]
MQPALFRRILPRRYPAIAVLGFGPGAASEDPASAFAFALRSGFSMSQEMVQLNRRRKSRNILAALAAAPSRVVWIGLNVRAPDGLPTPVTSSTTKQLIRFVVQPRSQVRTTRKPLAGKLMCDGNDNSLVCCTLRLVPKPVQSEQPGIPRVSATWRTTQTNLACSERRHAGGSVPMDPREKQTPGNRLTTRPRHGPWRFSDLDLSENATPKRQVPWKLYVTMAANFPGHCLHNQPIPVSCHSWMQWEVLSNIGVPSAPGFVVPRRGVPAEQPQ